MLRSKRWLTQADVEVAIYRRLQQRPIPDPWRFCRQLGASPWLFRKAAHNLERHGIAWLDNEYSLFPLFIDRGAELGRELRDRARKLAERGDV